MDYVKHTCNIFSMIEVSRRLEAYLFPEETSLVIAGDPILYFSSLSNKLMISWCVFLNIFSNCLNRLVLYFAN